MSERAIRLLLIGINYGTDAAAERFLRSAGTLSGREGMRVCIVDNSETPGREAFAQRLRAIDSDVWYLRPDTNLGYFGGAQFALEQWTAAPKPEWVAVSNVDIEFRDAEFLHVLDRHAGSTDIGVLAPSILSRKSLRDLNPRLLMRPRRVTMHFYRIVFSNVFTLNTWELLAAAKHLVRFGLRQLRGAGSRATGVAGTVEGPRAIYAPQGSCIVFARRYFERGGTLVWPAFLFGEEIFVAETATALGLTVVYEPALRLWHDDHASTGLVRSRKIARYVGRSAVYVAKRYFPYGACPESRGRPTYAVSDSPEDA